ncbi:MAG TPA: Gfo/Idh/MocA family oxidoreductase [Gaiellaceae bacterium]|nr:Gfo/Idh/MocA family oxidoreductase [Gaiellaceae bacterium]
MTPFRLAVVGAGRAGMLHAANVRRWLAGAELACVVEPDAARARQAAAELEVPALPSLEDALRRGGIDGVVVTTPTFTHAELTLLAAGAGVHVFCEKPMALTVEECDRMIAAVEDAGVVLQVGFVRRFQPEFVEARRRIEAGDVGEPMLVKSLTRGPGLPPPWAHDPRLSNGLLAEVCSHDFDSCRWLAGSEIVRVYAETANFKGEERGVRAAGFYDNAVVALRFASGALGAIDGTCPADFGYDARVEVLGSEGLLVVGQLPALALLEARARGAGTVPTWSSWPQRFEQGYREELRAFVEAARTGSPPAAGGADGRAAVAAVRAANRSFLEERPVQVGSEVPA